MKKKKYVKPSMAVYEFEQQPQLLQTSGVRPPYDPIDW